MGKEIRFILTSPTSSMYCKPAKDLSLLCSKASFVCQNADENGHNDHLTARQLHYILAVANNTLQAREKGNSGRNFLGDVASYFPVEFPCWVYKVYMYTVYQYINLNRTNQGWFVVIWARFGEFFNRISYLWRQNGSRKRDDLEGQLF